MNHLPDKIPPRYIQEPPPRRLDIITQAVLLCGDAASQFGWFLLAIGSVFFWTVAVHSEARTWLMERNANWESKAGFVISADSTLVQENGQRIWKYKHSFGLDGYRYFGHSYSVGKKFDPLQVAYIRYDANNPQNNHIVGMRRNEFSSKADWFLIVPAFGLLLLFMPVRYNLKVIRLLKIGDFTRGVMTDKYPTGETVKKGGTVMPEFRYNFQFMHNGEAYLASARTHQTDKVEDEDTEVILFNRYEPTFNLVYDAVSNIPHINENGKMESIRGLKSTVLFLPVFTLVLNLVYFVFS